jgi:GAF domain-containing protein
VKCSFNKPIRKHCSNRPPACCTASSATSTWPYPLGQRQPPPGGLRQPAGQGFSPRSGITGRPGLVTWVFKQPHPLLVNDVAADARHTNPFPERIPTRSELVVPIQTGGQFYGVLNIQSPLDAAFEQSDLPTLDTVARQLALGIENANLYRQLSRRLQQLARAETLMRLQRPS